MNKEDLKDGDIFVSGLLNNFINKKGTTYSIEENKYSKTAIFQKNQTGFSYDCLREPTPEQKHWLETCIKANKFISYDEAMKTFIPEYVECIIIDSSIKIGKIYKCLGIHNSGEYKNCYKISGHNSIPNAPYLINQFKPSIKEAYDAQFKKEVVKVKPFEILSYKKFNPQSCVYNLNKDGDYVDVFNNKLDLNANRTTINSVINEEGNIFMIGDMITPTIENSPNKGKGFKITGFRLNIDKSMICAITDTHTPYGIGIDKIEHFIEKDEFVLPEKWCLKITNENVNFCKSLKNKELGFGEKYPYTINGYYSPIRTSSDFLGTFNLEDRVEITFEQFKKYVLKEEVKPVIIAQGHADQLKLKETGIDSMVIPNETLLEKAERLYPIGTKFKCANGNDILRGEEFSIVKNYDNKPMFQGDYLHSENSWIVFNGKWAEIIGYEPQIGDRFQIKTHYYKDEIYIITDFKGSYNDPNSVITFRNDNWKLNYTQTVLLKNIKIIK